jgi:hypothetical protein
MFPCLSIAFRKKTGPNIREHTLYNTNQVAFITMDKCLIIKKTGKGSGHNEKVNKRKTLAKKDGKTPNSGNGLFSPSG